VRRLSALGVVLAAAVASGCGSASKPTMSPAMTVTHATTTTPSAATTSTGPSALQAEANSAATGDIPDNQVFLLYHNAKAGWSMKYPEGWAQSGSASNLAFRDKNNIVRVVVTKGSPTVGAVSSQLKSAHVLRGPQKTDVSGAPVIKAVYRTQSAPNSVTGKRVTLVVDRYYLSHRSREAIVDLGTPQGVDNVDAYRLMIESFRWR